MEMPELNEDILDGGSNSEMLTHTEDSASLDESTLQAEDQTPMEVDSSQVKPEGDSEEKEKEHTEESEDTLDDPELQNQVDDSKENEYQDETQSADTDEKADDEPSKKRIKLDQEATQEIEGEQKEHIKEETQQEPEPESESQPEAPSEEEAPAIQSQPDAEPEPQPEEPELTTIKKEAEEKVEDATPKEEKPGGPDTDMLATLASAALEQDPKDKTAAAIPPKTETPKTENETPKKKPENWCNVGVFDTNTTVVSDYLATPEPNEQVDLVTATLGGRRIQLEPGTAYKFRVRAVNGCGTGPWSDIAAFKTTLPGFPGAPSAIKISKSPEGAHLTWEPPGGNSSEILEYAVYLAVRSASQGCQPVTTNQAQLAFVRVFCGPTNKCMVGTNSLQAAHIDTTTKPAIIFRIAARNSKGYGPATQVRWLQESQNGTAQTTKRATKT